MRPRFWHIALAILAGAGIAVHSWNNDRIAQLLLSNGTLLEGRISEFRHVSESRLCSFNYWFTVPGGELELGTASLGKPHCGMIEKQLKKYKTAPVDVLWSPSIGFMLKIDAAERVQKSWGIVTYLLRFLLVAVATFVMAFVISAYVCREK